MMRYISSSPLLPCAAKRIEGCEPESPATGGLNQHSLSSLELPYTKQNCNKGNHVRWLINKRKEQASMQIRKLISPSTRFMLREGIAWLRELRSRACLWRWEIAKLPQRSNSTYETFYLGRKSNRELAKALLGIHGNVATHQGGANISNCSAFISEAPIPGALRVPCYLRVIIPLGRPFETITAEFDDKLRRVLRNQRGSYRTQHTLNNAEIDRANQELLQPYAIARHGAAAAQISATEVHRMAQNTGRLDLVLLGDDVVGCILGSEATHKGKRYWSLIRCGYPETVFSESKWLRETNAINFYLALEWATKNNFDCFDMGTCLGRPEDGLLQWKKRWGGLVDTLGNHNYFHVRLPSVGAAQFLWDAPLFAVEGRKLALHIGLPEGESDESFTLRYREMNRGMGIGGLFKIYLHHARQPSESLLDSLRSHYAHQKSPPIVESVAST
jgi:hypothetical protein